MQMLTSQLRTALQLLHTKFCLLHLDVKPGNILWCNELCQLQLCDFGVAEHFDLKSVPTAVNHQPAQNTVKNPRFWEYVTS